MLTNNKWTKHNADLAQKTALEHLDWMDNFGRMIYAFPEKLSIRRTLSNGHDKEPTPDAGRSL